MALRAAKGDEDTAHLLWGQGFALPPSFRSARNFTSAGSTGDLVAGDSPTRVFNGA
jgi:hypothetical protein